MRRDDDVDVGYEDARKTIYYGAAEVARSGDWRCKLVAIVIRGGSPWER